ncbi:MAG: replication-relaxation family protein, partial [Planctomycetes bacterium]|nr:replication-relaxation family protein [Planctomycetota bacterium]
STHSYQPTARDTELLRVIELLSPTSEQMLKWTECFQEPIRPFTQIGDLRRRLGKLHAVGLVRRWRLAIESQGMTPYYYKLTLEGHRALHGKDAEPRRSRAFSPIGLSLHSHTKALADFIVHTKVAAHRIGATLTETYAENEYRVTVGDESLKLDGRFTLLRSVVP